MARAALIRYTSANLAASDWRHGVHAMLTVLARFVGHLLSRNSYLLPPITTATPARAADSQPLTNDASTLTLAIVAFVTLAVYYAATGWRPSRRKMDVGKTTRSESVDHSDKSKRDAA
jgi:hypothetical protein